MKTFVMLSLVYAAYGIPLRYLEQHLPLAAQLAWMLTFGTFFGALIYHRRLKESLIVSYSWKDWGFIALKALTFYPLGTMLWGYGIVNATYANVSFINALPLASLVGAFLLREKISLRRGAAILVGFIGVGVIAWRGSLVNWGIGELAVAGSLIFYGISYVASRGMGKMVDTVAAAVWQMLFGAIMCWVVVLLTGGLTLSVIETARVMGVLVVMGGVNLLMNWLQNVGFREREVMVGGTILNLETVFGLAISMLLYAEVPLSREWLGGALIVLSAVLVGG
jgi:drug/metabolite transporter (DMT)-like permease